MCGWSAFSSSTIGHAAEAFLHGLCGGRPTSMVAAERAVWIVRSGQIGKLQATTEEESASLSVISFVFCRLQPK